MAYCLHVWKLFLWRMQFWAWLPSLCHSPSWCWLWHVRHPVSYFCVTSDVGVNCRTSYTSDVSCLFLCWHVTYVIFMMAYLCVTAHVKSIICDICHTHVTIMMFCVFVSLPMLVSPVVYVPSPRWYTHQTYHQLYNILVTPGLLVPLSRNKKLFM